MYHYKTGRTGTVISWTPRRTEYLLMSTLPFGPEAQEKENDK